MTDRARSARTYRIVRQLHLWVGAWGALAAILFGLTGFVQNHRALLRLPQGETSELSKTEIDVPEAERATPEALRDWLRDVQRLPIDSVRVGGGNGGRNGGGGARWSFSGGNARLLWNADYVAGSPTIDVRNSERSTVAYLLALHKGVGGGIAWILLTDSFALAMVALGVSGLWMWLRGRSARQMVLSILGVAVLLIVLIGGAAIA